MTGPDTPQVEFPQERVAELLDQVELVSGHHVDGVTACAMDLLGMAVDGVWTDMPECVHPWLAKHVHRLNDAADATPELRRRIVLECGPLLLGTAGRSWEWAVVVRHRAGFTVDGFCAAMIDTHDWADLRGADLRGADLRGADLRGADLRGADHDWADLRGADLRGADLRGADLSGADLRGADLSGANLRWADLPIGWERGPDGLARRIDP